MFKKNKGILKKILWAAALIPLSLFILSAHASCQNSGNDEQDEADDTLETKEPLAPVNRDYKPSEALAGTLGIDLNKAVNTDIIGPGVNFNFCYIKEMDLQKGGESAGFPNTAGMSEKDAQKAWDDFFGFIDYMDFTYVRFMVSCTMWEPVNDNSDPFDTDFAGGFVFSPDYRGSHPEVSENNYLYMEAMYKILDRFETAGKYVVLANWGRGSATFCPDGDNWLGEKSPDGFSYELFSHPDSGRHCLADVDELTESLAALFYHLRVEKNYSCIRGVSLWNEPETLLDYQETLVGMYNSMGSQLTRLGIRDKCVIQAYDGVTFYSVGVGWDKKRISKMEPLCGDNMDIISIHDYFGRMNCMAENDGATHGTFAGFSIPELWRPALEQASAGGKERRVIMGEMGTFAFCGGNEQVPRDFRLMLSNAEMMTLGFNMGFSGFGLWVYNLPWQTHFSMLEHSPGKMRGLVPDSTNYYPSSLLCKYIKAGASIVSSEIGGCLDSNGLQRVYAAAAKSGNEVTVLLVNDGTDPAALTITGLNNANYRYWYVCEGKTDGIYPDGAFTPDSSGGSTVYLRPQSITVLTTFEHGSKTVMAE